MSAVNEYGRAREIRQLVTRWISDPEMPRAGHETCVSTIPASPDDVLWLLDELAEAHRRMHQILSTIYDGISHRDLDVEARQAAALRQIERLARLDWDEEGFSRVLSGGAE